MYVNVVFVIRCLYSAVSLILVKEQCFIRIIIIIIIIVSIYSVGSENIPAEHCVYKYRSRLSFTVGHGHDYMMYDQLL